MDHFGADHGKTAPVLSTLLADPAIAVTQAARDGHILVFDFNVFLPTSPSQTLLITPWRRQFMTSRRIALC